jgi:hypothetical protein
MGLRLLRDNPILLDLIEYDVPKLKAKIRPAWVRITELDNAGAFRFRVRFPQSAPARWSRSTFYQGLGVHGTFDADDLQTPDDLLLGKREEQVNQGYLLAQRCLRVYNELMDAFRVAYADAQTLAHPCIHEPYKLDSFRTLRGTIEPTRRTRLWDFVYSSMVLTSGNEWVPMELLVREFEIGDVLDPKVGEVTRKFLAARRTNWANYLLDAVEHALDAEIGLAIVLGNVAIEIAVKELLEAVCRARAIQAKAAQIRRLVEGVRFTDQLNLLVPLIGADLRLDPAVIDNVEQMRGARNDLLHWGKRSGEVAKALRWLDAAREVCVTLELVMNDLGVMPSILQHQMAGSDAQ